MFKVRILVLFLLSYERSLPIKFGISQSDSILVKSLLLPSSKLVISKSIVYNSIGLYYYDKRVTSRSSNSSKVSRGSFIILRRLLT
jgi:hypothetical protein